MASVIAGLFAASFIARYFKHRKSTTTEIKENEEESKNIICQPGLSHEGFLRAIQASADWIVKYRSTVHNLPVLSTVKPGYLIGMLPNAAPEKGEDFGAILADLDDKIVPGLTHWASPNFFAYFKCHAAYETLLGDLISSALNVIGFTWVSSPACMILGL